MQPSDENPSFWARVFRCTTPESADREICAAQGIDVEAVRLVWSAHRSAEERAEARLEARVRDLEGLQVFGRALAEARTCSLVAVGLSPVLYSVEPRQLDVRQVANDHSVCRIDDFRVDVRINPAIGMTREVQAILKNKSRSPKPSEV